MRRLAGPALALALASVAPASAWSGVFSAALNATWKPTAGRSGRHQLVTALSGTCAAKVGGVAPTACRDWSTGAQSGSYSESSNPCTLSASGETCTASTGNITASATVPNGPYLMVMRATYPSSGSVIAMGQACGSNGATPFLWAYQNAVYAATGSGPGTSTGVAQGQTVEVALYWDGSNWWASAIGNPPIQFSATAPAYGSVTFTFGGGCTSTSYALTQPVISFRLYPGTFSTAQEEQASTL